MVQGPPAMRVDPSGYRAAQERLEAAKAAALRQYTDADNDWYAAHEARMRRRTPRPRNAIIFGVFILAAGTLLGTAAAMADPSSMDGTPLPVVMALCAMASMIPAVLGGALWFLISMTRMGVSAGGGLAVAAARGVRTGLLQGAVEQRVNQHYLQGFLAARTRADYSRALHEARMSGVAITDEQAWALWREHHPMGFGG